MQTRDEVDIDTPRSRLRPAGDSRSSRSATTLAQRLGDLHHIGRAQAEAGCRQHIGQVGITPAQLDRIGLGIPAPTVAIFTTDIHGRPAADCGLLRRRLRQHLTAPGGAEFDP